MIFAKATPYGIDAQLKRVQSYLDANLPWVGTKAIYGKVEAIESNKSVIPAFYNSNGEYLDIFIDDKYTAEIGFIVKDRIFENFKPVAKVDIIFTVNLNKVYNTTVRQDELALIDAKETLKKSMLINSFTKIKIGIDEVFNGYDKERIKHRDMQPWFVFSFETEISYNETKNCN
jgi:hypothetical protein